MIGMVGMMEEAVRGRTERISSILTAVRRLDSMGCQRMGRFEFLPGLMGNSKRSEPVMVKENVG